ncbi:MAG: hypothetical protein JWO09_2327 [Bacteroidetes bacterium]|nr:hypothetical protein [Bacteroidota bacterium]
MLNNFPKIYMWFYFLQVKATAPSAAESDTFVRKWEEFTALNKREPGIEEIHKLVLNE